MVAETIVHLSFDILFGPDFPGMSIPHWMKKLRGRALKRRYLQETGRIGAMASHVAVHHRLV
jgi:hypothetical protein